MSKRIVLNLTLALAIWAPVVACQSTASMADLPRQVEIVFQSYIGDGGDCDAKFFVDGDESPTVTLHKNPDKGPNQAVWTFSGGDYQFVWVILENNGLRQCLSNTDDIPKNHGGFRIGADGTPQTVVPQDCVNGEYDYLIRAQKMGGGFCGVDPKVKIED